MTELVITVAIVAVLASVAMPLSEMAATRAKETELRRALRDIRDALDAWKRASEEGRIPRSPADSGYPPTLMALVEGATDAKSPGGARLHFLRRVPRDPFHADPTASADKTWGLRSYESPHNDPRPGKDVFDIRSLSDKKGLNGIAYSEW